MAENDGNIMLNVPYPQKGEAKRLGGKWNPEKKQWYIPPGTDPEPFRRWMRDERIYINVPYSQKEEAKALGPIRWDPLQRQWFIPACVDPAPFAKWGPKRTAINSWTKEEETNTPKKRPAAQEDNTPSKRHAPEPTAAFPHGCLVVITALEKRQDLNGEWARVKGFVESSRRFNVKVEAEAGCTVHEEHALKGANLQYLPRGTKVQVRGLVSRPDLNESEGIVREMGANGRYSVGICEDVIAAKCENLFRPGSDLVSEDIGQAQYLREEQQLQQARSERELLRRHPPFAVMLMDVWMYVSMCSSLWCST